MHEIHLLEIEPDLLQTMEIRLEEGQFQVTRLPAPELEKEMLGGKVRVLCAAVNSNNYGKMFELLKSYQNIDETFSLLIIENELKVDQVSELLNNVQTFAILRGSENLQSQVRKAIEDHKDKSQFNEALNKVKKQNQNLEEFTGNLEQMVLERTKNEVIANQETEHSLKAIQSLLTFIKSISRVENLEEFLDQIRIDFKKNYGFTPPILILRDLQGEQKIYYYQGKQPIVKTVVDTDFFTGKTDDCRLALTHVLGRPFGRLIENEIKFQTRELVGYQAKVVFEQNLGTGRNKTYEEGATERWTIVSLALENILIKEGLQEIAKQWQRTFNEMKDLIIIVNQDFKVSLSNRQSDPFLQNHKVLSNEAVKQTLKTGKAHSTDLYLDGKVYRVHSYPIRLDEEESVSYAINQFVDITTTVDLQSRVIQGEKMAAVGLLAGNIAHELNNPLTGIHSLTELLLGDLESNSSTHSDMQEIQQAALRCQRIIKDLLEFSDLASGGKVKKVDINQIISKTLPLLKMAMRMMNSDIQLSDQALWVSCNPQLLQQVIFNLINNACQAMEEGGQLTVTTGLVGEQVEVRIRDNGPGIPEEIKESVFEPFFTTKDEGEGTGLGLSMSKSIIDRAGGELSLNPSYGDGTEFVIQLPVVSN